MNWLVVDEILKTALKEDAANGDITTSSILDKYSICSVDIIAKEDGVIAGTNVFKRVFTLLGEAQVEFNVSDGDEVRKTQVLGKIEGNTYNVLIGERLALNLLQRMSGIATITRTLVKEIEGTKARLLDTRKTTPNLRILEKYAAKVGGACNHRFNLSDGVLIKDNHISAAGGIKEAVGMVRNNVSFIRKIEVEVESLEQVTEALESGADIIMLDNMDTETMKKAVEIIDGKALTEASGNVDLSRIRDIAGTGVDFISAGMITHSVKALDISMKNLKITY